MILFQEEQALLKEIDVTGKAFEEMQEQNSRLLQQLKEKDDANFKLMSDRIKANQLNMLFKEERQVLQEQVKPIQSDFVTNFLIFFSTQIGSFPTC